MSNNLDLSSSLPLSQSRVLDYNASILRGETPAGKWIYAAARRFQADRERTDIYMEWAAVAQLDQHFQSLALVGEFTGQSFQLHDWQLWALANLIGWRNTDGRRRIKLGMLQVARGNGKTTLMAGLALWDLLDGEGKRVHVIANNEEQAGICLDTARQMVQKLGDPDMVTRHDRVIRRESDCVMTALPAIERSLDGLNPSLWIADEAAEFKGRFLTKLLTTGAKRRESLGIIISTPGSNPESHYSELVKQGEDILSGELIDDATMPLLYGIDITDQPDDESAWPKANPGMAYGQPEAKQLRRSWTTMRRSPMGRGEFIRYHCARTDENTGGWLDMNLWPKAEAIDWESLRKRPAWVGLDLSKSQDMTALVVAVPLDDGRVALRGHYWWPSDHVAARELDYRMPVRQWAAERKLTLTPGAAISYEDIKLEVLRLREEFDVRAVGYDAWGAHLLAEQLTEAQVPLVTYRMGIATFAPGCALWQNMWSGGRLVIGDDPILRRSCAEAHAKVDINGNVRPIKSRTFCILDPLVASIMAVHVWGGKRASCYEDGNLGI